MTPPLQAGLGGRGTKEAGKGGGARTCLRFLLRGSSLVAAAAADPCKDNTHSSAFLFHVGHSHLWEKELHRKQIPSVTLLIPAYPVKDERIFRSQFIHC